LADRGNGLAYPIRIVFVIYVYFIVAFRLEGPSWFLLWAMLEDGDFVHVYIRWQWRNFFIPYLIVILICDNCSDRRDVGQVNINIVQHLHAAIIFNTIVIVGCVAQW